MSRSTSLARFAAAHVHAWVVVAALAFACAPALAGIATIAPPEGSIVVDFDDVVSAPTSFANTIALRTLYAPVGVTFSAPGSDGGAILDQAAGFSISGNSAPNFLAFNVASTLQGGGHAKFPETLLFRHSIRYLQFNVADSSGMQVTAEAFDKNNNSLGTASIATNAAMQTLVLEARHIAKVVISGGGLEVAIDDVAFLLDTTVIDFDDLVAAPTSFATASALRDRYAGQGLNVYPFQQDDGGAILGQGANLGVTGFSPPNFLAFDNAAVLATGSHAGLPAFLHFNPPVRHVEFLIGDVGGSTIEATAYASGGAVEVDSASLETGTAMQRVVLDGPAISSVQISSDGATAVIDDLEFLIDGTLIDFDDNTNPFILFNEATALRDRYKGLGVRFSAPGNDGAAVLLANPNFGVTGYSGTNYLAVDAGDQLGNGATPKFPETIRFDTPMKRVEMRIADDQGSRIFVEARDANGDITATTDIYGTAKFQNVFLYFDGTTELTLTSNGSKAAIDDLAFAPMDACEHDPCYQGDALTRHCSACVTKVCAADADCCGDGWGHDCAFAVDTLCDTTCAPLCGDANLDRKIAAGDALAALRTAVGLGSCPKYLCDWNGDDKIVSGDALQILRTSVKLPSTPKCPPFPG